MVVVALKIIYYGVITYAGYRLFKWTYRKVCEYMSQYDDEFRAISDEKDRFKFNPFHDWDTEQDWLDYMRGDENNRS